MDSNHFMLRAYGSRSKAELRETYDAWADTYDADTLKWNYKFPSVCAALTTRYEPDIASDILDAGCGTGQVGELLAILGYSSITGIDLSESMLAKAERRSVYKALAVMDLLEPLRFEERRFSTTLAVGCLTTGHVSHEALGNLIDVTKPGGKVIFSLSVAAFENGGFKEKQASLESAGRWRRLEVTAPFLMLPFSGPTGQLEGMAFVYETTQ